MTTVKPKVDWDDLDVYYMGGTGPLHIIADAPRDELNQKAARERWAKNAPIIAEAFNVHTETGRTPRQLADERGELLAALRECLECEFAVTDKDAIAKAESAIAAATGAKP